MDRSTFQALHATGRLPSPKGVALHLMRLIQREHVTTGEIAEIIMSDPALAGRVIASANSASHYGHRPVVSVAQAIAVNGMAATSRLALGLSIIASHQTGHCRGFDYSRFWIGSVVAALAMQNCAVQARIGAPAEMFTLGLLHRIGERLRADLAVAQGAGIVRADVDAGLLATAFETVVLALLTAVHTNGLGAQPERRTAIAALFLAATMAPGGS